MGKDIEKIIQKLKLTLTFAKIISDSLTPQTIQMKLLDGKTAIVTGGSRGIGEAIALKFAEHGANVAITYFSSAAKAEAVVAKMTAMGVKAVAYKSDAASFTESETLVKDVMKEFGRIDVLVNNAGVTRDNLILRMSEAQWDEVMMNNLKSVFNLTKQVIMPMMKAKSGSIINLTSVVGITGNAGQSNYAASKAGVIGFTQSIAKEYGSRNIRTNAIAPGFIETEMTESLPEDVRKSYLTNIPLGRMGSGEEVANACLFLASNMSSYVNGQTLAVCGGMV